MANQHPIELLQYYLDDSEIIGFCIKQGDHLALLFHYIHEQMCENEFYLSDDYELSAQIKSIVDMDVADEPFSMDNDEKMTYDFTICLDMLDYVIEYDSIKNALCSVLLKIILFVNHKKDLIDVMIEYPILSIMFEKGVEIQEKKLKTKLNPIDESEKRSVLAIIDNMRH